MSRTDYDEISEQYKDVVEVIPKKTMVESYTYLGLITSAMPNGLQGKDVLEMACGEGYYTRKFATMGPPRSVTAIDISAEMIKLAEKSNTHNNIRYVVGNCANELPQEVTKQQYDIVLASFLLHEARSPEMLRGFIKNIYDCLKPGCPFITVNDNHFCHDFYHPDHSITVDEVIRKPFFQKYQQYRVIGDKPMKDGDVVTHFLGKNPVALNVYWYDPKTVEETMREVGFSSVKWQHMKLRPDVDAEFWKDYMDSCPNVCLVAVK